VAPCSHTWHYKCIRALLQGPTFPIFVCPNCRATADLEADVEEPEEWELPPESVDGQEAESSEGPGTSADRANSASLAVQPAAAPRRSRDSDRRAIPAALLAPQPPAPQQPAQANGDEADEQDPMDVTMQFYPNGDGDSEMEDPDQEHDEHDDGDDAVLATNGNVARTPTQAPSSHATSNPMSIPPAQGSLNARGGIRTPSPDENGVVLNGTEGPITPRNDAGPWVFDGSGVRLRGVAGAAMEVAGSSALPAMPSMDAAAVTMTAANTGGQKANRKRDAETTSL
jgi:E3 ubiquitin-protein ligase DMA1/2